MSKVYKIRPFGLMAPKITVDQQGFIYYCLALFLTAVSLVCFWVGTLVWGLDPMLEPIFHWGALLFLIVILGLTLLPYRHRVPEDEGGSPLETTRSAPETE
jgi:fatty acid desaturase